MKISFYVVAQNTVVRFEHENRQYELPFPINVIVENQEVVNQDEVNTAMTKYRQAIQKYLETHPTVDLEELKTLISTIGNN